MLQNFRFILIASLVFCLRFGISFGKWISLGRVNPQSSIEFTIAVKQQNIDKLEPLLLEISDPDSPVYGHHLSKHELDRLISPSNESIDAILNWLASAGISAEKTKLKNSQEFIKVKTSFDKMENLMGGEYRRFRHSERRGFSVIRASSPIKMPLSIAKHIDFISPSQLFPAHAEVKNFMQYGFGITPDFLRDLYHIDKPFQSGKAPRNRQAVANFLGQFYSPSDLEIFFSAFNNNSDFDLSSIQILGPNNSSSPGIEANMDIQYLTAIGDNISTQFWSTLGRQPQSLSPTNEPFLEWLIQLSDMSDEEIPLTISVSYGDDEHTVNLDYARRVNIEFIKAGLRGISILFASGDGGVAGSRPRDCTKFVPTFPAASPWVTAVGGTMVNPDDDDEYGVDFSTGGFSNYWPRPSYQDAHVKHYVENINNSTYFDLFNVSGAGFPDVSALSEGFYIVHEGESFPGGSGTSASVPSFTGIVSLLNDIRLLRGQSPLGFLNPLFYKRPDVFNDIDSGENPGCGTSGFQATRGWDPVTGLGTPNFPRLLKLLENLPPGRPKSTIDLATE